MAAVPSTDCMVLRLRLRSGGIDSVHIASPRALAPPLHGRPAAQLPGLVGGLYALCGHAHAVAARIAVAAACGERADPAGFAAGLDAERIADAVRTAAIGWPHAGIGPLLHSGELAAARDLLGACREVVDGKPQRARDVVRAGRFLCTADFERRALSALPPRDPFAVPRSRALGPAHDAHVIAALRVGGGAFARQPELPGALLETGSYARCGVAPAAAGGTLAARMRARLHDLRQALRRLEDAATLPDAACAGGSSGAGDGWGAIESPRGRLYHWLRVDAAGTVCAHAVAAPTEWNFHPDGPLARAVRGTQVADADEARVAVGWLAALFDPCVPFRVEDDAQAA